MEIVGVGCPTRSPGAESSAKEYMPACMHAYIHDGWPLAFVDTCVLGKLAIPVCRHLLRHSCFVFTQCRSESKPGGTLQKSENEVQNIYGRNMADKVKLIVGKTLLARRESSDLQRPHDRPDTTNEIASNMIIPCPHYGSSSVYNERFNCCHIRFLFNSTNLLPRTLKEVKTPVNTFADIQIFHLLPFLQISNPCLFKAQVYFTPLFIMQMMHILPALTSGPRRFVY